MFSYKGNSLYAEGIGVKKLAETLGTPLFIYSRAKLVENYTKFDRAFRSIPHIICFALKANSNLSVARTLRQEGAGADIVSGGELFRALKAGFNPAKIVFSGVGKTKEEMRYALRTGILMFNVESVEEMEVLNQVAGSMGKKAPIALRINPDVKADTHHHITTGTAENKFGIHKNLIFQAYRQARSLPHLQILGMQAHIGSQITTTTPFVTVLKTLLAYREVLAKIGIRLKYLDVGGGLGITYNKEQPPTPMSIAKEFAPHLTGKDVTLLFEPGRFLAGEAGILVTRVLYRKANGRKTFVIVDAGMNDLARPALYDAYHKIVPVVKERRAKKTVDIVGPVCESGDYFARHREIPFPENGDYLAIENAGAYGFAMSSQYNSRPRACEVLVSGTKREIARKRETLEDLIRGER